MAQIHTHYDNLKVARNAPPEIIRAAYKALSQKYHPDRNGNNPDAIRIIQIINTAYAVLSDPVKRREHDDWIARTEAHEGRPGSEGADFIIGRSVRHASRSHRGAPSRHSSGHGKRRLVGALQRTWQLFDDLSRKLLRKS